MKTADQHLYDLQMEAMRISHPSIPEKYRYSFMPTYTRLRPEKRILRKCEDFSNLMPLMKMNIVENTGVRVDNRKVIGSMMGGRTIGSVEYRKSSVQNGTADMVGLIDGRFYALELKRVYKNGKDKQSAAQKAYQKEVEDAGGKYIIFKDFEEFHSIVMTALTGKASTPGTSGAE